MTEINLEVTMKRRLLALLIAVSLLATAAVSAAAAPTAGPCVAGGSYNPACDVDHNGIIDILDIQLTAGHWNTNGVWVADGWSLTGNATTTPGANYLGTSDNQALELRVNGSRALLIQPGINSFPNIIGGSSGNGASAFVRGAAIGGGGCEEDNCNWVYDNWGTVGGGVNNQVGLNNASVSIEVAATVGGGSGNIASGEVSTVGGGSSNTASYIAATVAGGVDNTASGLYATVAGGGSNTASGLYVTVAGGTLNTASGNWATVAGGNHNTAAGNYSFAAGRRAKANNTGAFVMADSNDFDFTPIVPNAFTARFTGGARFVLGIDGAGANTWLCAVYNGGSWGCSSDRNVKENFQPVDGRAILEKLATLPITTWNAIGTDPGVRRMGPMSQDFYAAFGLGDDDKVITTGDLDGVALASIQGLYAIVQAQEGQIAALQQENTDLQARLAAIEQALGIGQ
jgi:hypothetical protein